MMATVPANIYLANVYLESCLAPFAGHLARADVTDIYINGPGELWIETLGGEIERHAAPELTEALLDFLETWLVEHILGQDQELGDYLRARGIPA